MMPEQKNGFKTTPAQFPPLWRLIKHTGFSLALLTLAIIIFPFLPPSSSLVWLVFYPIVFISAKYISVYSGCFTLCLSSVTVPFILPMFSTFVFKPDYESITALLLFLSICSVMLYLFQALDSNQQKLNKLQKNKKAIQSREELGLSIINSLPNMIGYWDKNLNCLFANNAYQEWFNKPPEKIMGMTFEALAGKDLYQLNKPHIKQVLNGIPQRFERKLQKANGDNSVIIGQYIPHFSTAGEVVGFSSISSEVTDLKATQAQLRLASYVFDNTVDGVLITDINGTILSVNPAFEDITGYSAAEAIGQTPRILKSDRYSKGFYTHMWETMTTTGKWNGELWSRRKNGDVFLERLSIRMVRDEEGKPLNYISVFSDITELWRKDEHLKHLAFYDALTNLPNRMLLMERLEQKILNAQRDPVKIALMFMDLDGFKLVNDTFGHDVGDEMLKIIAQRLEKLVRQSDTVARLGGDEFIFVLNNPSNKQEITEVAQRVLKSLNEEIKIGTETFVMGASIGISEFPYDCKSSTELIKNADRAMYLAKASGKNQISFFISTSMLDED